PGLVQSPAGEAPPALRPGIEPPPAARALPNDPALHAPPPSGTPYSRLCLIEPRARDPTRPSPGGLSGSIIAPAARMTHAWRRGETHMGLGDASLDAYGYDRGGPRGAPRVRFSAIGEGWDLFWARSGTWILTGLVVVVGNWALNAAAVQILGERFQIRGV